MIKLLSENVLSYTPMEKYQGYIDVFNKFAIEGWFLETDVPEKKFTIEIYFDGILAITTENDIFRDDVKQAYCTSGKHGFHAEISHLLTTRCLVEVKVKGIDFVFQNHTQILDPRDPTQMVAEGQNGWLFLKNDSNATDNKLSAKQKLSTKEIEHIITCLKSRNDLLSDKIVTYIIPDRNVFIGQYAPYPLEVSNERDCVTLMREVFQNKLQNVFYGEDIGSNLSTCIDDIFLKNDSHVTDYTFFHIYQFLMSAVGLNSLIQYKLQQEEFIGDLGNKLSPSRSISTIRLYPIYQTDVIKDELEEIAQTNSNRRRGCSVYHKNIKGNGKKCLIFGTSSGYYMLKFFYAKFSEVKFIWSKSIDKNVIQHFHPDIVFNIVSEKMIDNDWS